MAAITFGPILQLRDSSASRWGVSCIFSTRLSDAAPRVSYSVDGATFTPLNVTALANLPITAKTPKHSLWRFEIPVELKDAASVISYRIGDASWKFTVPSKDASPRMAYGSCNGFSDPKLMNKIANKNERWDHLLKQHQQSAFNLLILGGDQIYTDSLWDKVNSIKAWMPLKDSEKWKASWTKTMEGEVDEFFTNVYVERWTQPSVRDCLASIPTIMMWDDHDIIDGWGSYPKMQHESPVYTGIFNTAKTYFSLFQLHCRQDERHPSSLITGEFGSNHSLGFSELGDVALLVPDLRSERRPEPDQIISPDAWKAIYSWLDSFNSDSCSDPQNHPGRKHKHLIVVSSIPVCYLDLGALEKILATIPGQQELEDDLKDHWRSNSHRGERLRLIHRLLDFARKQRCRVTLLSGDVHVGALSVLESTRNGPGDNANIINQLVSTGIVHPAPPVYARFVLEQIADKIETVDTGICSRMMPIGTKGSFLIGSRNWLSMELDDRHRLWANWHVEGNDSPITKVIHPTL